jgi:hypothetical protein
MSNPPTDKTYSVVLVGADGHHVIFESCLSKDRAETMRTVLLGVVSDVEVVEEVWAVKDSCGSL